MTQLNSYEYLSSHGTGIGFAKPQWPIGFFKSKHTNISIAAYTKPRWLTRLMVKWLFECDWHEGNV